MSASVLTKFAGFTHQGEGQIFVCNRKRVGMSGVSDRNAEPHFCVHRTLP